LLDRLVFSLGLLKPTTYSTTTKQLILKNNRGQVLIIYFKTTLKKSTVKIQAFGYKLENNISRAWTEKRSDTGLWASRKQANLSWQVHPTLCEHFVL